MSGKDSFWRGGVGHRRSKDTDSPKVRSEEGCEHVSLISEIGDLEEQFSRGGG